MVSFQNKAAASVLDNNGAVVHDKSKEMLVLTL